MDINGALLACLVTPANRHDMIPARKLIGRIKKLYPAREICILAADLAYDAEDFKKELTMFGIAPFIIQNGQRRKKLEKGEKLLRSANRWIVEAAHSWSNNFRSLLTRFAKHDFAFSAFYSFACAIVVFRKLYA